MSLRFISYKTYEDEYFGGSCQYLPPRLVAAYTRSVLEEVGLSIGQIRLVELPTAISEVIMVFFLAQM